MYPEFFGLEKLPFRLRPDPDFLYSSPEYLRARAKLLEELHGASRATLLAGPAGVGKTLLLEDVLRDIGGQYAQCRINQPQLSAAELIHALSLQLGTPPGAEAHGATALGMDAGPGPHPEKTAASPNPAGTREAAPLLIVDDAHLLATGTLRVFEEILARAPRMKVLLVGRDGEWQRVAESALRVPAAVRPAQVRLAPLSPADMRAYVERRLAIAGGGSKELFTPDAYAVIFQHTAGAARLVNVLCDAALHAACARAAGSVSGTEILLATQDSRWPEAVARDKAGTNAPVAVPSPALAIPSPTCVAVSPSGCARLIVSLGSLQIATLPLAAGRTSIGRATDNSLRLDAPYISRHHCYVETADNVSTIEDLGSVNGICINGKIVKRRVLQHEDKIILGEHVLTYMER